KQVNEKRREKFQAQILDAMHSERNQPYREMIEAILAQNPVDALDVAAAMASLLQGDKQLFINEQQDARMLEARERESRSEARIECGGERGDGRGRDSRERFDRAARAAAEADPESRPKPVKGHPEVEMVRFMVNVGYNDGLKPGNLVGAVANEADLDSEYIGHIEMMENFAVVDLPNGMPAPVMNKLKKARVRSEERRVGKEGRH